MLIVEQLFLFKDPEINLLQLLANNIVKQPSSFFFRALCRDLLRPAESLLGLSGRRWWRDNGWEERRGCWWRRRNGFFWWTANHKIFANWRKMNRHPELSRDRRRNWEKGDRSIDLLWDSRDEDKAGPASCSARNSKPCFFPKGRAACKKHLSKSLPADPPATPPQKQRCERRS